MGRKAAVDDVLPRQHGGVLVLRMAITMVMTLTLTFTLTLPARTDAERQDNCQLTQVYETIIKEMTLEHNNEILRVSCTAEVELHKCEGQCESRVTPSVRHAGGFRRDCRCCKEGEVLSRTVILPRCFHNGQLQRGLHGTTEVSDLQSCSCTSCTN